MKRLRHGHASRSGQSPTYTTWKKMRARCEQASDPSFENYGARGVRVCERWQAFENFLADMGERPKGTTIDRIDQNGHYQPGNCRWATYREQARNMRSNVAVTFSGRTQCIAAWEADLGMKDGTLYFRLRRGWSVERAITTPVQERRS